MWTIYHTFLHRNLIMWNHVQYSTYQQNGGGNAQSYATDSRVASKVEPSGSSKHYVATGLQLATPSGFHRQSEGHSCKSIRHTGIFQYGTQPCPFPGRRWMLVFRVNAKKKMEEKTIKWSMQLSIWPYPYALLRGNGWCVWVTPKWIQLHRSPSSGEKILKMY